jgi:hypothetical protein
MPSYSCTTYEQLPIVQSIFRSASRRETLGKHLKGGRRGGELKILCIMSKISAIQSSQTSEKVKAAEVRLRQGKVSVQVPIDE